MGYHLSKQIGFIEHNGHNIDKIMHNGECVFSQGFDRESTGTDSVTCEGTIGKDLMDWSIVGNTVQDDTPTPENPIDIKMVGDKTENLIDFTVYNTPLTYRGLTFYCKGGEIYFDGSASSDVTATTFSFKVIITERATLSFNYDLELISGFFVRYSDDYPNNIHVVNKGNSAALSPGIYDVYFRIPANYVFDNLKIKLMLNSGSTPLPYEPYGYKLPMMSRGKNLWNPNGKSTNQYGDERYGVLLPKGTYTLTNNTTNNPVYYRDYDESSGNIILLGQVNPNEIKTVTFTKQSIYWTSLSRTNIQLEIGDTATEYEPYQEPITTPIYLSTPLVKDEILRSNGTKDVKWGMYVCTGDEASISNQLSRYDTDIKSMFSMKLDDAGLSLGQEKCSHFRRINASQSASAPAGTFGQNQVKTYREFFYFNIYNETIGVVYSDTIKEKENAFKAWLKSEYDAGHPVTVWYQLEISTTETVDIPQISTFRNEEKTILGTTTVITTDTEVKPSQIDASYKSNKIEYVTLTDDNGNVTKMRKSDYDDLKTNELLDILEVM